MLNQTVTINYNITNSTDRYLVLAIDRSPVIAGNFATWDEAIACEHAIIVGKSEHPRHSLTKILHPGESWEGRAGQTIWWEEPCTAEEGAEGEKMLKEIFGPEAKFPTLEDVKAGRANP